MENREYMTVQEIAAILKCDPTHAASVARREIRGVIDIGTGQKAFLRIPTKAFEEWRKAAEQQHQGSSDAR